MIGNSSLTRLAKSVRPRNLLRATLLTGGAATGMFVSVAASYGVVSTLFPQASTPAAQTPAPSLAVAPAPDRRPAVGVTAPASALATEIVARLAEEIETATPVETPQQLAVVDPSVTALPSLPPAPTPAETIVRTEPVERAAPVPEAIVEVTMGHPAQVPPTRPAGMAQAFAAATAGLPSRAIARPLSRPEAIGAPTPAAFVVLATGDEARRTGATLGFAAPSRHPEPRPKDTIPAIAETTASALMSLPATRPAPRPQTLAIADTGIATIATMIPTIRPAPRPEMLRLASSAIAEPAAPVSGSDGCGRDLAGAIPSRHAGAESGSQFLAGLSGAGGSDRDTRIIDELARGNMPGFLRALHPVTFRGADSRGIDTEIVVCVTPDYLALGSETDFVRVPLGLPAAARIAGKFDMTLPTPRMVDAIYAQADVRLSPSPMTPGPQMSSTGYLLRHNATIEGQRNGKPGLISGHKKDVVMASRMARAPGRVAIYGWHRTSGKPIQPVSTVHGASYADYSHGIRLVSTTAYLNGRAVDLDELLASSRYAGLINNDGPLPGPVIRIASR